MTTPDPVLAATTADVRKRCDELEAENVALRCALTHARFRSHASWSEWCAKCRSVEALCVRLGLTPEVDRD